MRKVSDVLREEREKKEYSLECVQKITKIKIEYLKAIEEGKFSKLPSESYALGFIKNYADFLGLPKPKIIALFRREYEEEKREIVPEFRKNTNRFSRNNIFDSKNILIIAIFVIVLGYIFFQYGPLFYGPPLEILTPKNTQVITNNVIEVSGKTDPYAVVSVDGEDVSVALDGSFKKSIYAFPGEEEVTVIAKNRFGKETKQAVKVKVE